ncbi:HD-GYP domain-containing protein [Spiribacter halobius]|uniref:Metal-dependent phosphohydrolase n=1 Tax=Sediminicurvatus halobius TaxID=2182432 RepID=A0A2U2MVM2_9GAMM|nr:HD-GYP domain-containing protein [Spiribacter halobius]PWG60903.1 metal-dependent phosphohydrolase [Spiribacter halobius]
MGERQVAVGDLMPGLYVVALDRPWLGTPFLFQGFSIEGEPELRELRRLCRHVFIDEARSRGDALRQLDAGESSATPGDANEDAPSSPDRGDVAAAFGIAAYPEFQRFWPLVRVARDARDRGRRVVDRILEDARLGHSIDADAARSVVRELVTVISENASASLWLTNLRQRDEYTANHCLNVCVLAIAFGRHLGLGRDELEALGLGGLLHDVGKMRTPEAILKKPGVLSKAEREIIRRHPDEGVELLSREGGMPKAVLEMVRLHHERVNGKGYPLGLTGDVIPRPVLVVGICDVYDAMTSDRAYQEGIPPDRVLRLLFERADQDFGQELTEAFIRCLGIYPAGSLVELDDGSLAVVVSASPEARLHPVVMLVRHPDGRLYDRRVMLNLAELARDNTRETRNIRHVVNPGAHDIDVAAVLAADIAAH